MVAEANRLNGAGINGRPPSDPPSGDHLFDVAAIKRLRQMRFNPLPMLNPDTLGMWLDQFDSGMLSQAAQLWDQMCRRDDTLVTVKPQLENDVAAKDWGYFVFEGADETEGARHREAIKFFYENLQARDAFDRNVRGGRDRLFAQMMQADSFTYAVHHFAWKPRPGQMLEVDGAAPVPALTAMLEYVPLWFFENTTGELRLLRDGVGFGVDGEELDWESGEWMVTTGRGLMFAASICVTFKRLTFQDWTLFNERYAQNKVVGTTPATAQSTQGQSMAAVLSAFNSDQEILITEWEGDPSKSPISLLGPSGTASVDVWERFLDRQDRKMSSMYRGNDLSMMSRGGKGEDPTGASLQGEEGDTMLYGACRNIAGTAHEFITRKVIEFCFGPGVEPLAYIGLPDLKPEDVTALRESAGFIADRGGRVSLQDTAERLGVQLVPDAEKDEPILEAAIKPEADPNRAPAPAHARSGESSASASTTNAADEDLETFLGPYRDAYLEAFAGDLQPFRTAMEHVVQTSDRDLDDNVRVMRGLLPQLLTEITGEAMTALELVDLIRAAMKRGWSEAAAAKPSLAELAATAR